MPPPKTWSSRSPAAIASPALTDRRATLSLRDLKTQKPQNDNPVSGESQTRLSNSCGFVVLIGDGSNGL
ncbi:hypothetical protein D9M68_174240 [compost metagenome]